MPYNYASARRCCGCAISKQWADICSVLQQQPEFTAKLMGSLGIMGIMGSMGEMGEMGEMGIILLIP